MENLKKALVNRFVRKSRNNQTILEEDLIELEGWGEEMIAQNLELYLYQKVSLLEKKGDYVEAVGLLMNLMRKHPGNVVTRLYLDEFIVRLNDVILKSMTDNFEVYSCLKLYELLTDLGHTNMELTWVAIEKYEMLGMKEKALRLRNAFALVNPNYIRG